MTTLMIVLTSALALATGVVFFVAARLVRALRHTVELEGRIARMQEGLHLLTDTAETGFRQVAAEIERLSSIDARRPPAPSAPRPTAARLRAATRRGQSVKEIAVAERVSEGEVRLRLSLADAGASGRARTSTEPGRASLRA